VLILSNGCTFNRFQGRGIVVTASGQISGQAIGAYVTVYILRKVLKCDLPIEVFFVGPRETFSGKLQAKLRELGNVKVCTYVCVYIYYFTHVRI
jgi:hypothetical protein